VFELDTGEGFGENVSPVVTCVNFGDTNGALSDVVAEVVVLDGKMLCTWVNSFRISDKEAALVVFKDVHLKVARKDVGTSNGHIINKAMRGKFLDKSLQGKDITHASAESLILSFGGAEGNFHLEFAHPGNGASAVNNQVACV